MDTKLGLVFLLFGVGMATAACTTENACNRGLPNIIIMLMDDMGWGDIGCYGNEARETPNIDKLAKEGAMFTDFYAAYSTCSPSRAAMLTGRLPVRTGIYTNNTFGVNAVFQPHTFGSFPAREETIAEVLDTVGYVNKLIGKWHLGNDDDSFPLNQGFHEFYGSKDSRTSPFPEGVTFPNSEVYDNDRMIGRYFENEFFMDMETGESNLTRLWSENALEFIERNKDNPFFLYWSADGCHKPVVASKEFLGTSERGVYGDVIRDIDYGVGQIISKLKEHDLDKNTLVFFGSDNGNAAWNGDHGGTAGPFLCSKSTTFEGGMRVPGIFWWPGVIPPGQIERNPANLVDIFPTILDITGASASDPDKPIDGQSLWPLLIDVPDFTPRKNWIFYYRGTGLYAVRVGDYKAHYWTWNTSPENAVDPLFGNPCPGYYQEDYITTEQLDHRTAPILFHLGRDPGERFPIDQSSAEYAIQMRLINRVLFAHVKSLIGDIAAPELNLVDNSLYGWSPPGCATLDMCLPVPESNVTIIEWRV